MFYVEQVAALSGGLVVHFLKCESGRRMILIVLVVLAERPGPFLHARVAALPPLSQGSPGLHAAGRARADHRY